MAARKQSSSGSKPPPRPPRQMPKIIPREDPPEEGLDAGWFEAEEPKTKAKLAAKTAAAVPAPAPATPKSTEAKKAGDRGLANAARLLPLPPKRHPTMEVQVDWLEQELAAAAGAGNGPNTIPVEAEWLEADEEEPPTVARGRRTPVGPPPIPGPPPLPKNAGVEDADPKAAKPKERAARRPSGPPQRGKR